MGRQVHLILPPHVTNTNTILSCDLLLHLFIIALLNKMAPIPPAEAEKQIHSEIPLLILLDLMLTLSLLGP